MHRRTLLVVIAFTSLLLAAGSGAFTSMSADRGVSVTVADDENAYLAIQDDELECGNNEILRNQFATTLDSVIVDVSVPPNEDEGLKVKAKGAAGNPTELDPGDATEIAFNDEYSSGTALQLQITPVNGETPDELTLEVREATGSGVEVSVDERTFDVDCANTVSTPVLNRGETIVYQGLEAIVGTGGKTSSIGASGVEALGSPKHDLTGDGSNDLPYVKGGNLKIIDSAGNIKNLVGDESDSNPDTDKTLLAVGKWQGSSESVFYVNENHEEIWRVDSSGSTTKVATPSNGANAVMGTGDIDGDGTEELLFADGSQQIRYLEPSGTTKKLSDGGAGSNNGIGVGQPPDFDGDGTVRAVVVDGSNNVKIVSEAKSDVTLTSTNAKKAPVTTADVDDDGSLEIVYVDSSGDLKYVDEPLGSATINDLTDNNGNQVSSNGKLGVVS